MNIIRADAHRHIRRLLFCILLFIPAVTAVSHPHIFVENNLVLRVEESKITGIRHVWHFDEMFSSMIIKDFTDGDYSLSKQDVRGIREGAFRNLENHDYFTHITVNGEQVQAATVDSFSARLEGRNIIYDFTLKTDIPVGPEGIELTVGVYDTSYYTDVQFSESEPLQVSGNSAYRLEYRLEENSDKSFYSGQFSPVEAMITLVPR